MDLAEFTATLTPAYASDLMAGWSARRTDLAAGSQIAADPVLGAVKSVVTYNDYRVFAVAAEGIFAEEPTRKSLRSQPTNRIDFSRHY